MEQRRHRRKNRTNRNLLVLVAVLLIIFVAALVIAGTLENQEEKPQPSGNPTTGSSGQTQPSTAPTVPLPGDLTVTFPEKTEFVWTQEKLVFTGTADPKQTLTIQGATVQMDETGAFSHAVTLSAGQNRIPVTYLEQTVEYIVEYRYAAEFCEPLKDTLYKSGATIQLRISAREGSTVAAKLNGNVLTLKKDPNQVGSGIAEGFVLYTGTYVLPSGNVQQMNLGPITYTVTCNGVTESYTSEDVICEATTQIKNSDPSVTPNYGEYINVGSGYIMEVISYQAETFNGRTVDDSSSPERNYLPKGTVDYASTEVVKYGSNSYMKLRCGRRVYVKKNNWPSTAKVKVVDCYIGTLPDHNEIGFASLEEKGHFTVLTLDVLWKAPFYFDLAPQTFNDPASRDFRVTEVTAEYVDITFCYATSFEGTVTIPENNPLFRSAELTQKASDCTLRLYLKNKGGFYGWDSYYNEDDQLCFQFLNPVKAKSADNVYGADLTGIKIQLDVGHGGLDGGSPAVNPDGSQVDEAELNLNLALVLKKELESMGATVVLNRTDDSALNVDERIQSLKEAWPDICIAIHQNAYAELQSVNGVQVCYYSPYSQPLAKLFYDKTVDAQIYRKNQLKWHYYFVARQTNCPVVLMENGYMTNPQDLADMQNEAVLQKKAEAMAKAVADYFLYAVK